MHPSMTSVDDFRRPLKLWNILLILKKWIIYCQSNFTWINLIFKIEHFLTCIENIFSGARAHTYGVPPESFLLYVNDISQSIPKLVPICIRTRLPANKIK